MNSEQGRRTPNLGAIGFSGDEPTSAAFAVRRSPFAVRRSTFDVRRSTFAVRSSLFTVHFPYHPSVPELPDVTVYIEALRPRIVGHRLLCARIRSPFVLRTFDPPVEAIEGEAVRSVLRMGKRIVIEFDEELFAIVHLMIAGRFRWSDGPPRKARTDSSAAAVAASRPGRAFSGGSKIDLASFEFESGVLTLTEASQKKRASLHIISGRSALVEHDPAGLDVLSCTPAQFIARLRAENRTLKRALASPRLFDGIGNAYSDEILHAARLSPMQLTGNLEDDEAARLHAAARDTLLAWTARLRTEFGLDSGPGRFPGPGQITAFRPDFAAHGKFGKPCPACGTKIQRIIYAENECNYCPRCQTGGKVLADRSMSRLLKDDWPRTVEEWESQQ